MKENRKSFIEELENYINNKDKHLIIETRAINIIESAINLIDQIKLNYTESESIELEKRLLNSIKSYNPNKFKRKIREYRKIEGK